MLFHHEIELHVIPLYSRSGDLVVVSLRIFFFALSKVRQSNHSQSILRLKGGLGLICDVFVRQLRFR
jgi:hypothetical protein